MSYFDIHDILGTETLVPATFRFGSTRLGSMFGGSSNRTAANSDHVVAGATLELPLWLCKVLASKDLVSVKRPTFLGHQMQRRLTAGAACENLKARCPYFYAAARHYCNLDTEQDVELATVVFNAFRERYHKVAGGALGLDGSADVSDFRQKLSMEEMNLFEGAIIAAHQAQAWTFDHELSSANFQEKGW